MIEYDTDPDRAQQLSNAALAMMAELGVAAHPNNYTIFFNYLSGEEPDLKQTINILRSNHREFDELQCRDLFTRFLTLYGNAKSSPALPMICAIS